MRTVPAAITAALAAVTMLCAVGLYLDLDSRSAEALSIPLPRPNPLHAEHSGLKRVWTHLPPQRPYIARLLVSK